VNGGTGRQVRLSHTEVSLLIPNEIYREWEEAARETGHTIDSYLVDSITIATRMRLLQGIQRLPQRGAAIDPLVAEAVRRHAEGKPWQHKADLLLATPGLVPEAPLPQQPDPAVHRPVSARVRTGNALMARHGLPTVPQAGLGTAYAVVGGNRLTQRQTALVLAIWEHAADQWTGRRVADLAAAAGLTPKAAEWPLKRLVELGLVEQRPHPRYVPAGPHRTARNQHRLEPDLAEALRGKDVRAA
jgi:hypothetical protein